MNKKIRQNNNQPKRCWWCGDDPLYVRYHDEEWGRPVTNDNALFERMSLEGFQAGLSWITILKKRENFRAAFADFIIDQVAAFDAAKVEALLQDAGIIRHRGKIEAVINNAGRAQELRDEFGSLWAYFKAYVPQTDQPEYFDEASVRARTQRPESTALSKDLKKRGFKFVGPTTMYALMQAIGMVNDHVEHCHVRDVVEELRTEVFKER